MTDEEKQAILDKARRNIAEAREITRDLPARLMALPIGETRNQRHRRELTERDEAWAREKAERDVMTDHVRARLMAAETDWQARIDQAVAAEHSYLLDQLLPEVLAELQRQWRAETKEAVDKATAMLKLEVGAMKHEQTKRKRSRASNIVDLPNPLTAKQR